jgi:hypothetical protein
MSKKKTKFLGMNIPENISEAVGEDAKIHFRTKTQHIIWILDRYILGLKDTVYSKDSPKTYSTEDIKTMKDNYYKNKEGK